ncbi:diguanylate cyclase [Sporosarcina sp. PTS2304]|nr:diguanylate cyclase [Sporosarcina sp. PTS2304]
MSGIFNVFLSLYVYRNRHQYKAIATIFSVYTGSIAIYCFAAAFGLLATSLESVKLWTVIQYIGLLSSPLLGLLFIMKYVHKTIRTRNVLLLLVIPITSFFLLLTNNSHHLYYRVFEIDPVLGAPYIYHEIGNWYVIQGIFTFCCMFAALLLALSKLKEITDVYRPQLVALVVGQLLPIIAAFCYLVGFAPRGIDPVPMVLWISSAFYVWAITSSRMFSVMPIAKDVIFHHINDCVIVLDASYRLIEFNQASKHMLPQLNKTSFGKNFKELWNTLFDQPTLLSSEWFSHHNEQQITFNQSEDIYQLRVSPVIHSKQTVGYILIFTDVTEQKQLLYKLERQAYYDELTGIYNRRAFFEKAPTELITAQQQSMPYTIILIDIDYFKQVNDTYGHHIGDLVLKNVVSVCKKQMEDQDILFARYGGEEFVVAFQGIASEGEKLANQMRKSVEESACKTKEEEIAVTISCGVASTSKEETLTELLIRADDALYSAKGAGRNRVHIYLQ